MQTASRLLESEPEPWARLMGSDSGKVLDEKTGQGRRNMSNCAAVTTIW